MNKLTWDNSRRLLAHDDQFISVDLGKVLNNLWAESFKKLHSLCIDTVGSLTRSPETTVTLEEVLADMEFCAGGGVFAGAERPISLVVMRAYLKVRSLKRNKRKGVLQNQERFKLSALPLTVAREPYRRKQVWIILQQQLEQLFLCQILKTILPQKRCVVWRSQTVWVFALFPKNAKHSAK